MLFDDSGNYPYLGPSFWIRSNCARMSTNFPAVDPSTANHRFLQREIHSGAYEQREDSYPTADHGKRITLSYSFLAWNYDWLSYCSMIYQGCMMLVAIEAEASSWRPFMAYHPQHHSAINLVKDIAGFIEEESPFLFHLVCLPYWVHAPSLPACSPPRSWSMSQASCASPLATLTVSKYFSMNRRITSLIVVGRTPGFLSSVMRRPTIKVQTVAPMSDCHLTATLPIVQLHSGGVGCSISPNARSYDATDS